MYMLKLPDPCLKTRFEKAGLKFCTVLLCIYISYVTQDLSSLVKLQLGSNRIQYIAAGAFR
jgi:hypothetical protein